MKIIKNICLAFLSAATLTGCEKHLMDLNPYESIGSGNMWTNENLADMGVMGIYNTLRPNNLDNEFSTFDSYGITSTDRDVNAMVVGTSTTGDSKFSNYWRLYYEGISRANDAITNLSKANLSEDKYNRLMAESKFLRAYFYFRLNAVFRGVPLYLEPTQLDDLVKERDTEENVWKQTITDLTDAINTSSLPDKYAKGHGDYGRITKGAAYALRGKIYMYLKEWGKAEADFRKVGDCGYALFQGDYKQLFKEANEQCEEMIFSVQCIGEKGYGNTFSWRYGQRSSYGGGWNTYTPNTDFVDTYEFKNGKPFNWNDVIEGYNEMDPQARSVYFLRDGMTDKEKKAMSAYGADLSKYLPEGNEARILKAYNDRDPRLLATVITPYAKFLGANGATEYNFTLRWPFRVQYEAPYDMKVATNSRYHYMFRKFVAEGATEIPARDYSPIDIPVIRYADVVLSLAECLNEQNKQEEAIEWVNKVRARVGIALLNSNEYTQVTSQENLRERIRNERRWEFAGEGVNFFDEMRWNSLKESKYFEGSGYKQIWGASVYSFSWKGDYFYNWPIPRTEIEMNPNLKQNEGWID